MYVLLHVPINCIEGRAVIRIGDEDASVKEAWRRELGGKKRDQGASGFRDQGGRGTEN